MDEEHADGADLDAVSLFAGDRRVIEDPYPLYEAARRRGPVVQEPFDGVFLVTGFDEIMEIATRPDEFSSAISAYGPWATPFLPARPEGCPFGAADLTDELVEWKATTPFGSIPVVTYDPPYHTALRAIVNRLFTPARLRDIQPRLADLARDLVDRFAGDGQAVGRVDYIDKFAAPFPFFVINEVFGVPPEDRQRMRGLYRSRSIWEFPGDPEASLRAMRDRIQHEGSGATPAGGMSELDLQFLGYMRARRGNPTGDTLSEIANARFSDGTLPDLEQLVEVSRVVYGAGHNTTTLLLASAMHVLATRPDLQTALRDEPERIPAFVDEVLRVIPPSQGMFRLARRDTEIGGVPIPAGAIVWLVYAAANRDASRFECPNEFDAQRANARQSVTFGHGIHFCPGATLARVESRIALEELLRRMGNIRLDPDAPPVRWAFWFVLRGPDVLHLRFDPIS